jgi:hypothetical protein
VRVIAEQTGGAGSLGGEFALGLFPAKKKKKNIHNGTPQVTVQKISGKIAKFKLSLKICLN